ncbi:MAG: replicative DNA helicase [Deltaproteobacteria bacterium]|nr:replicative DNA helicase [Deltaproteobacteria bacterium]MDQ3295200.1 replicative DNA helicase [Myxococcota bacterium]
MARDRRVLPHNLDAEASVLGGIILRNEVLIHLETLEVEDFYDMKHKIVFAAIRALEAGARPIDVVTLENEIEKQGKLDAIGGIGFLGELALRVPTADNVVAYAEIVTDKNQARKLMLAASDIAEKGYEDGLEIRDYLDEAEGKIFEVTQRKDKVGPEPIKSLVKKVFSSLDERFKSADGITGVPTGFADLDARTAGLQPTELIILAARPAMGKTSFALSLAQNAATSGGGWPCLVFSLEMSSTQLAERMLCSEARVDSSALRRGQLQRQDMTNLTYAAATLSKAPILIDDTPALSLRELRARARRFRSNKELFGGKKTGLIVVDYLQLMRGSPQAAKASREQEISEISRGLKALAKELDIPVLALSQLNRSLEQRTDKRPQLSDLRECVTGETLVALADGRHVPIAELVGTTPEVVAMTPDGKLLHAVSDKVWSVGKRPVFDVVLASGRKIRCTAKHRLYGADGWKRVEELAIGDRLAITRELPAPKSRVKWPDEHVALLGQMLGDGSFLKQQPMRYTTESEENAAAVTAGARALGCEVKRYAGRRNWFQLLISGNGNRWAPAGVNKWFRELGIFGLRSHEKRIPVEAFRLGDDQIALLLRHLWATDGCIWTAKTGQERSRVYFATTSEGLAQDVAALLLRLGIVGRVRRIAQGEHRSAFPVDINGLDQQQRFLDVVGAFGPRVVQAEALRGFLQTRIANTNVDTLPIEVFERVKLVMGERGVTTRAMAAARGTYGGTSHFKFAPSRATVASYADILDDHELRAQATSDLFWDRIVTIEAAGEAEVFDLTVPGPTSWIANTAIVSHNSGAIEQDADVIMFIYRDVIYNKEAENPHIAEVIIGKNRHGATGTVETHFEGRYTRFENLSQRSDGPPNRD